MKKKELSTMLKELLKLKDIPFSIHENKKIARNERFLNKYTRDDLYELLTRFGVIDRIHKLGVFNIEINTSILEDTENLLYIHSGNDAEYQFVTMELREGHISYKTDNHLNSHEMHTDSALIVDWLTSQNPLIDDMDSLLPGQDYPGLKLLNNIHEFLIYLCKDLEKDCLLAIPEYYHVAEFYSPHMKFINPIEQAKFIGIRNSTKKYDVFNTSWAIHSECLINKKTKSIEIWEPTEMIEPFSSKAIEYFQSDKYNNEVNDNIAQFKYKINKRKLKKAFNLLTDKQ